MRCIVVLAPTPPELVRARTRSIAAPAPTVGFGDVLNLDASELAVLHRLELNSAG